MPRPLSPSAVDEGLAQLPGWTAEGNASISRTFTREDHIDAMGFVTRIAMAAEVLDHHPELTLVYNSVSVTLSSHDAGGVTERDFALARKIEQYAGQPR